jgi:transcriptional regulator with XRE-family HTH domain
MPIATTPTTQLGARIRDLRNEAGLSQWNFAIQLGTQANRVSDWEIGKHTPTLALLARIAQVLGITVSELLEGVM